VTDLLSGRFAVVTGSSQGLGFHITDAYLAEGASVAICARNADELAAAEQQLRRHLRDGQRLLSVIADVTKREEVDALFAQVEEEFGTIDILVNNAGIYGPLGLLDEVPWSEWETAITVNLLGSALAMRAVIPIMKSRGYGKIIQLSGGGATTPLPFASAYAASKMAVVRLAETVAEELRPFGIMVNSIAPGALNTRLLDEAIEAGPERIGREFYEKLLTQKESGGAGFEAATQLAVFLGSARSDGITGKLISAIWDDWEDFPLNLEILSDSDLFTIRRITREERPLHWKSDNLSSKISNA